VKKLRYGVIGAGWVADRKHLKTYAHFPNIELVAICNHQIERAQLLAEKYQIPFVFDNYEEMLRQCQLDIVSICSPNALHLPMIEAAIKNHVHIHCEKPLVLNEQEAERILLLNQDHGVKIFVGMNYRFDTAIKYLKELVTTGQLGEVYHIKAIWNRRRGIPGLGGWFTNRKLAGGGPLIDLGVHLIDLSMFLLDFPNPIHITGQTYTHFSHLDEQQNRGAWASDSIPKSKSDRIVDVEDMAIGLIKYDNYSTLYIETSWAANLKEDQLQIELFGTNAGAKTDGKSIEVFGELSGKLVDIKPIIYDDDSHIIEVQSFLNSILHDTVEECTVEQAKKVMHIIDKIYNSEFECKEE
jgi:predicted dehydrogenase